MEHPTCELNQAMRRVMFVLLAPHLAAVCAITASWSCCSNGRLTCSFQLWNCFLRPLCQWNKERRQLFYLVFLTCQKLLFFLSMNSRIRLTGRFFFVAFGIKTYLHVFAFLFSVGTIVHCDWKHTYHYCCSRREVQLWSAQSFICPNPKGKFSHEFTFLRN